MSNITANEMIITEKLIFRVPYAFVLSLLFLFSVIAGSFVCYVIKSTNMMRKRIWFYFFMVSFVDASTSFFAIPLIVAANIDERILLVPWICNVNKALMVFFACWSLLTLAALSLYKCTIISTNHGSKSSYADVIAYFIISLSLSLLFATSPILGFSEYRYYRARKFCIIRSDSRLNDSIFSALCGVTVYFIPLCVIIISSMKIYRHVHSHGKVMQKSFKGAKETSDSVLKTLLLLVFTFFVCWTPLLCTLLLGMAQVKMNPIFSHLAFLLMFVQSCVDPVIYCFRHTAFQNALKKIIQKRRESKQKSEMDKSRRKRTMLSASTIQSPAFAHIRMNVYSVNGATRNSLEPSLLAGSPSLYSFRNGLDNEAHTGTND